MDMMSLRRRVLVNQNKLVSATGNPLTFNTPLTKPLKECVVRFTPKQSGSGTPSPENVREIVGKNGITVWQSGKNLFDKSNVVGGFINSNGEVTGSSSSWVHQYIYIKGINKLTISGSYSNTAARNVFFDADMNPINIGTAATTKTNRTLTVPSGAVWYGCSSYINPNASNRDIDTLQVEIGETATEYESYTGNEITFSWGSDPEIGTIYGGYVDCETADLVVEYAKTTFGTSGWIMNTLDSGYVFRRIFTDREPTLVNQDSEVYCDSYASYITVPMTQINTIPNGSICGRATYSTLFVRDDRYDNVKDFVANMSNAEVAYKLKTPIHYSLTPQSIATLRGENVMWSDANGDITVRYWTR